MAQLAVEQFLAPIGPIDPDVYFPGRRRWPPARVQATVESWKAQGYSQAAAAGIVEADAHDIVRAWVRYRAASHVYDRLSGTPASVGLDSDGSTSYTQEQIDSWKARADDALAEYTGLLDAAGGGVPAGPASYSSEIGLRF